MAQKSSCDAARAGAKSNTSANLLACEKPVRCVTLVTMTGLIVSIYLRGGVAELVTFTVYQFQKMPRKFLEFVHTTERGNNRWRT
jgi:hypothetical protein